VSALLFFWLYSLLIVYHDRGELSCLGSTTPATCQAENAAPPWSGGGFAASRERTAEGYRATEGRQPDYLAHKNILLFS
jgi:hypothetical protein